MGLDKIIKKRNQKTVLGFGSELIKSSKEVDPIPDDFVKFGLIPEFIGRLPIIAPLHELDADCLIKILTEPKNSLVKQYTKLFTIDGVDLEIDKSALELIAQEALSQKTGARGLRNIMEKHLRKAMYLTPSNKLVKKVTLTNVNNNIDVKYSWEV